MKDPSDRAPAERPRKGPHAEESMRVWGADPRHSTRQLLELFAAVDLQRAKEKKKPAPARAKGAGTGQ